MSQFEFKTRISYDDVDDHLRLTLRGVMGMMQEAAIIHSDAVGYSVYDIPKTHVIWMLVNWRVRLCSGATWNENVVVRTWPRTMEKVTSERDFEIIGEDGRCIAIGESLWVLVSADTGRIVRISKEVSDAYELTNKKVFDCAPIELDVISKTLQYSGQVCRRDIDSNHHVNNRVYLDYAVETLPDTFSLSDFSEVFVHYRKQLLYGEKVQCFFGKTADCCEICVCGKDSSDVRATVVMRK